MSEEAAFLEDAGVDQAGFVLGQLLSEVAQLKGEQVTLQSNLKDMQRQMDLQRLATAELIGRSQSSASIVAKFEEVAQKTTAAAEQLEAEIAQVREATARDVAAFRAELQAEIPEICAKYVSKSGGKLDIASISTPLDSMREAIQGLQASVLQTNEEDSDGYDNPMKPGVLTDMRKDIASCLDAANAAVRLGEHLTTELHREVDARCSDMQSLRSWVSKAIERLGKSLTELKRPSEEAKLVWSGQSSQVNFEGLSQIGEVVKTNPIAQLQSPFPTSRESPMLQVRLRAEDRLGVAAEQTTASLPFQSWSSQKALVSTMLDGGANMQTPGILLSGGEVERRVSMPAGERYLANQRRSTANVTANGSGTSPRQARLPSPIKNYHLVQRLESVGQSKDIQENLLSRPQSSPRRENPLTATHLQVSSAFASLSGSSATIPPGIGVMDSFRPLQSARTSRVGLNLARSISPVLRRTSVA